MVAQAGGQGSLIGATIGGYEVVALIGRGAMGAVYLARDVKLNRLVALKVLLGSLAKSPSLVKQFHQEAQASAPLNHPSIVRVYSAGMEGGTPYIAMEYVEGEPLDRFLQRKGRLKWDVAMHIGYKLAQGLEHAHAAGIVHRDIKPSNIMLDKSGGIRLADFGIAKIQSEDDGKDRGGSVGFLGTPQFMSPEQATNHKVGPSSDLYSLGVTMFQMISGQLPFTGESSMALINSICNDEPIRLNKIVPEVPDDVARFVAYLLGKSPKDRPANAKVAYSMMKRLQTQKGESTSLSDGLSEFIHEEMDIHAFKSVGQERDSSFKKKKKRKKEFSLSDWKRLAPFAGRAAVIGGIGLFAFWLPTFSMSQATVDSDAVMPDDDVLTFRRLPGGIETYTLSTSSYRFSDVQWIGDESIIWLRVEGLEGSAAHGDIGVLAVDVQNRSSKTLAIPSGPSSRAKADIVYGASMRSASVVSLENTHLLSNRFLMAGLEERTGDVVVMSRPWNRVYADPRVLLRMNRESWVWGEQNDPIHPDFGEAIINPNGKTICYLRVDETLGHTILIEQSLESKSWLELSHPRTSPGSEIISGSVQFSPDGNYIFYLRQRSSGGAELWRVSSRGQEQDGQNLIVGVLGNQYSISPTGDLIVLTLAANASSRKAREIALIHVDSDTVRRLGPGQVSQYAWHPSGDYFVVTQVPQIQADAFPRDTQSSPPTQPMQLVVFAMDNLDQHSVITNIRNGVQDSYAVSQDGRYICAIAQDESAPSLLVLNWRATEIDQVQ